MAGGNEELRDKLTQRGSKDPALPPWVIRDCFTILDFAGCMVPAHHPPMDWDTPQGLPRAAPITPNRLVAGLVCVHQYLEDQTEAGKLQKQVKAVTGPLLDLVSFRERKSSPGREYLETPLPSFGVRDWLRQLVLPGCRCHQLPF